MRDFFMLIDKLALKRFKSADYYTGRYIEHGQRVVI